MNVLSMTEIDLYHKRVLIREDFNVPINEHGEITSLARIEAALPTIKMALQKKARIILMSHLGRPQEGEFDAKFSLKPVAEKLSELLERPVRLIADPFHSCHVEPEEIVLLENTRFLIGEKQNQEQLSRQLASLCDVFIMDAFAVAHRAQASTYGVAQYAPIAAAGPLLLAELQALEKAIEQAQHPIVAIVAGSKVSTKLKLLTHLSEKADIVIVGGGIANTFLAASGCDVGRSLVEKELIPEADKLLAKYTEQKNSGYHQLQNEQKNETSDYFEELSSGTISDEIMKFPLPIDVIVAKEFSNNATAITKSLAEVEPDDLILDIGPKTAEWYADILLKAKTIIWNGPVGVFEFEQFGQGTKKIAETIAKSSAFSIAGGGDTIAAIEKYHVEKGISYISTGGGAFLELLQGSILPGVAILYSKQLEFQGEASKVKQQDLQIVNESERKVCNKSENSSAESAQQGK